jgi:hypothetical protein
MNQWSSTRTAVFWPHFFTSGGSSSDNPVLIANFIDLAGRMLFYDNEELGRRMLARTAKRTRLSQKICSPYPGVTPSNPPLKLAFRSLATSRSASGTDN